MLASGVAVPWALRAAGAAGRRLGRLGRRLVGDLLDRAAPRRPTQVDRAQPAAPRGGAAGPLRHPAAPGRRGPGRRGVGLDARRARPDRAVRPARDAVAGHRRVRALRHPPGAAPALPRGRRVDRRPHAGLAGRLAASSTATSSGRPSRSTRSATCRPPPPRTPPRAPEQQPGRLSTDGGVRSGCDRVFRHRATPVSWDVAVPAVMTARRRETGGALTVPMVGHDGARRGP